MRYLILTLVLIAFFLFHEVEASNYQYSAPESFQSLKNSDSENFKALSEKMHNGGKMRLIDNLSLKDLKTGQLVVNIMLAEEEGILSTDEEYAEKLEALFERHKIESWDIKKWNGFERVGSNQAKLEYFVKTISGRQLVVLVNYYTEEGWPEKIESFVLGISLSK